MQEALYLSNGQCIPDMRQKPINKCDVVYMVYSLNTLRCSLKEHTHIHTAVAVDVFL